MNYLETFVYIHECMCAPIPEPCISMCWGTEVWKTEVDARDIPLSLTTLFIYLFLDKAAH